MKVEDAEREKKTLSILQKVYTELKIGQNERGNSVLFDLQNWGGKLPEANESKRSYFESTKSRRNRLICFSVLELILTAYLIALVIIFRNSEECLT
jgi:hypothetical protein